MTAPSLGADARRLYDSGYVKAMHDASRITQDMCGAIGAERGSSVFAALSACREKMDEVAQAIEAQTSAASAPPPPIAGQVIIDERGRIWFPDPAAARDDGWHLHAGLGLAWTPAGDGIFLHLIGGPPSPLEGFACSLSRVGLRLLIADFEAIDAQLGSLQ